MRSRLGKLGLMTLAAVLAVGLCGAVFASWTDDLVVQGVVETGEVDLVIEDISGTWVYKDLLTGNMVVGDAPPPDDPDVLPVAAAWVEDWDAQNDTATMMFENVFPGPLFCADLVVHYWGVPGHVTVSDFYVLGDLEPYVWWEIEWPDGSISRGGAVPAGTVAPTFIEDLYQLHECETFEIRIYCQIPQEPPLNGLTSSVFMQLEAEQFNECIPEVEKELDLPDEQVHLELVGTYSPTLDEYGDPMSYFDAYITNAPAGYEWLEVGSNPNGSWPAWCCEFEEASLLELDVTLVSTIGMVQWEPINWLLNQTIAPPYNYDAMLDTVGGTANVKTHGAKQRAFWNYVPGGYVPTDALAIDLINAANANSSGFVPGSGQLAAVICQDGDTYQTVFIEVDP